MIVCIAWQRGIDCINCHRDLPCYRGLIKPSSQTDRKSKNSVEHFLRHQILTHYKRTYNVGKVLTRHPTLSPVRLQPPDPELHPRTHPRPAQLIPTPLVEIESHRLLRSLYGQQREINETILTFLVSCVPLVCSTIMTTIRSRQ